MTHPRKRYLLLELDLDPQEPGDQKIMYTRLIKTLKDLFGEFGLAQIELRSIESKENLMIVRCRRGREHMVRCAALMLAFMDGKPIKVRTLRVSGTLNSLKRFLNKGSI
ncbi:MAG: Rpp14/Pop5 family protein [Candidatus Bathyarchaeia archaeon]